ncbi:MAG: triose-phosphate isomerase [Deltaproteobacteria bacterium]|nr:triose-phosphate isomerase [Deltaproteobacteria bacterium]
MNQERRFMVLANWKMHQTRAAAMAWCRTVGQGVRDLPPGLEVVACPPHPLVALVARELAGAPGCRPGAQDAHWLGRGPHTGDVSAPLLADAGARFCLTGHSERRRDHGEDDQLVRLKVLALLAAGLTPIACLGEERATHQAGRTLEHLTSQFAACFRGFTPAELAATVVLYEPVWAVGSGEQPRPGEVGAALAHLRELTARQAGLEAAQAQRLIYGGSVGPANLPGLLALGGLDGVGLGSGSLDPEHFLAAVRAAAAARVRG